MAPITAHDVKRLRDATGAGMMDAKRALVENDGDFEAAGRWLREKGLGKAAERTGRENVQGAVAVAGAGRVAAMVELKSETDFVAMRQEFVRLAGELAELVAAKGEQAVAERQDELDGLKISLKENIDLGRVVRFEAGDDAVIGTYLHQQGGRGVNGVIVEVEGGGEELAREIAMHIAFGRPRYISRQEVPDVEIEAERATLEAQSRNEGKPEAALPKIVEGRLSGWYKERVLLEQGFVRDDKRSVKDVLGGAVVRRYAQIVIGP
jgi:elongation factor Ts